MESFLFAAGAVLPIILAVLTGYFLKRSGLIPKDVVKPMNKLVFRLLLPSMLFLNIYNINSDQKGSVLFILFAVLSTTIIYLLCIPPVCAIVKEGDRRSAILHASIRSNNALIGVALAESLCGAQGVQAAALLSAAIIPLYNVLAVISLTVFQKDKEKVSLLSILKELAKNPLIIGIALGLLCLWLRSIFVSFDISFRLQDLEPVMKVLQYFSNAATPIALLMLGAGFEFSAVAELKKEIILGTALRVLVVPVIGLGAALMLQKWFEPAHFAVYISIFATPVAVSSVPMTQEMKGNTTLAGQLVVWSTILSAFSVFFATVILKSMGIFS